MQLVDYTFNGRQCSSSVANMGCTEEEVLRKNHTFIIENVKAAYVKDHLYQDGVLSRQDLENLDLQSDTDREKMRKLMNILGKKGPGIFINLLTALRSGGQEHVARCLEESYQGEKREKEDEIRGLQNVIRALQQQLEEMGRCVDTFAEETKEAQKRLADMSAKKAETEKEAKEAQKRLVEMERLMSATNTETEKALNSLQEQIRKIKRERDQLEAELRKKNDIKAAIGALVNKQQSGSPPEEQLKTYKSIHRKLLSEQGRQDLADSVYTQLVLDHSDSIITPDLLSRKAFVDINVTIGNHRFSCHKALLVAWSDYFLRLLGSDWDGTDGDPDGDVSLEESELLSAESFAILHCGLYKGKFDLDRDTVGGVLQAAFYLEMGDVVDLCVFFIKARYKERCTSVNKMMTDLQIANSFGLDDLAETVLEQMAAVFETVCTIKEFQQDLSLRDFLKLLGNDMLIAEKEDTVFVAAFTWLLYDVRRLEYTCDILKSVRLGLVSVSTLVQWTSKKEVIAVMSADGECRNLLLAALTMCQLEESKDCLKKHHAMMFEKRTSSNGMPEDQPSMTPVVDMELLSREALRNAYKKLAELKPDWVDLEIHIDGRTHSCHRAILCGWSGYLQRELASTMAEAVRPIPQTVDPDKEPQNGAPRTSVAAVKHDHVTSESLSIILDFIYLGTNRLDLSNICDVMASCRFLQMAGMTAYAMSCFSLCLTPSLNTLDPEMLTVLYSESAKLDINFVHDTVLKSIVTRFKDVSLTDAFLDRVDVDGLLAIIRHPNLQVSSEDVVFRAVLGWLHKNHEHGRIAEIVKSIRLGLVTIPTVSSGIQFASTCKDSEARTILRHAADRESDHHRSAFIKENYPYMFEARKNQAYYERLQLATVVDGTKEGPGNLVWHFGICVSRGRLLVTDAVNNRLVAYCRQNDSGTYKYLCHVELEQPAFCVADEKTGTTYVSC